MDKIIQVSNPVQGVVAGQTAFWDAPIGQRYHAMIIEVTATGAAGQTLGRDDLLGLLDLQIEGKSQRQATALELDQIQTKYGADFAALLFNSTGAGNTLAPVYNGGAVQGPQVASQTTMLLRINFSEPWRKSYAAREARALPTAWPDGTVLKSMQLKLGCPNTGKISGAAPYTMRVHTVTDTMLGTLDANKNPVRLFNKWYRLSVPYTGAGDLPIVNPVKITPGLLAALEEQTFFCQAGDDISRVIVTADSRQVRDVIKAVNDVLLLDNGYNPALNTGNADRFDLDYDYSDLPTDGLILSSANGRVQTHKIVATLIAAAAANKTISLISQVYGPLD